MTAHLFRVFAAWTTHDGQPDSAILERTATTPAEAACLARESLAPRAREGIVLVRKIKRASSPAERGRGTAVGGGGGVRS